MKSLDDLAASAKAGDKAALDALVRGVANFVYGLAIRMLWHPADAEDASQEILIKVVTHLGSFRGDCTFKTWAYRVATNHLRTGRKRHLEQDRDWTFEHFAEAIADGLTDPAALGSPIAEQKTSKRICPATGSPRCHAVAGPCQEESLSPLPFDWRQ